MTLSVQFVLLLLALISFFIAAIRAYLTPGVKIDFIALGFMFVVAAYLFG